MNTTRLPKSAQTLLVPALALLFTLFSLTNSWAGACNCVCCHCSAAPCSYLDKGKPFFLLPFEGTSPTAWVSNRTTLTRDLATANLVSEAADRLRKKMRASGAITLQGSDFNTFASPGKSQLTYLSNSQSVTFDMVIGNADATNAQTWALPADLTNQLNNVSRADFIPVSRIPASLSIMGVTHASKYVAANRQYVQFRQYQLKANELQYLGYAVDRKIGNDFAQSSPDANNSFATVPLTLGASYTDVEVTDDPTDDTRYENTSVITFDGFGTINTPNGSFQALRYTMITTGKTYDVSDPNNPEQIDTESGTQVGWVTQQGTWITATYTGYNATTKSATLSNVRYSAIVPTSSLSPNFTNPSCNCTR
jgi:hypothetical protein